MKGVINIMAKDTTKTKTKSVDKTEERASRSTKGRYNKRHSNGHSDRATTTHSGSNPITAQLFNVGDINFDVPVLDRLGPINALVSDPELGGGDSPVYVNEWNIYTVEFLTTLGDTKTANLAAQKTFGDMRRKLNVPTTYEAGDLFCLSQAVQSINVVIEYCKKILRLSGTYSAKNRQFPRNALYALGKDIDDIITHGPSYRDRLNKIIAACAYMYLPTNYLSNVIRCDLASKVFADSSDAKAQTIIPIPRGMWKWNLSSGTSTTPSNLEWIDICYNEDESRTFSEVLDILEDCVYTLLGDSDAQRIFGDILKVWENDAWVVPQEAILADEVQEITFDPTFLYMFHNATVLQYDDEMENKPQINWVIPTGGSNPELQQSYYVRGAKYFNSACLIDLPAGLDPTAQDILNMCRWKYFTNGVGAVENSIAILGAQSLIPFEILVNFKGWSFTSPGVGTYNIVRSDYVQNTTNPTIPTVGDFEMLSPLSIYPVMYVAAAGSTNYPCPSYIVGDRNNFALVTSYYLNRVQLVLTQINYLS